jgi:phosphatidylethanolamine/phosphatidyl-N-methylethanolamine N-methyltransferase
LATVLIKEDSMLQRAKLWFTETLFAERLFKEISWQTVRGASHVWRHTVAHPWTVDKLHFYRAFRANPKGIGAIAPSSAALGRAITREINHESGPIIELGAGTGVFTRALIRRGVTERNLAVIEMDPRFALNLSREFPDAEHYTIDAAKLDRHTLFGGRKAGAAVCGLPLLNMPLRQQFGILRSTFSHLRVDGACYLFTYGLHCPVNRLVLDRVGLRARKINVVLGNMPPAHVWKINRRGLRMRLHSDA